MNDVTAVVLTIGETTTHRALKSVKSQSLQPCDIIVIENIAPFHVAMNQAIEQVQSEIFVQVDADMILDKDCFAILRKCMEPQVGMVVGDLRDPLVRRVVGVKMYRKACFKSVTFGNSISPDTDVTKKLITRGWSIVRALSFSRPNMWEWHTFGDHHPEYTLHYTYSKYLLEGRRYRYRRNARSFVSHLAKLQKSEEKVAIIAQVVMSHGIFLENMEDGLKPYVRDAEWSNFEEFLESPATCRFSQFPVWLSLLFGIRPTFRAFYRLGITIRQANAYRTFSQVMKVLRKLNIRVSWIPLVALSHGVFSTQFCDKDCEQSIEFLNEFMAPHLTGRNGLSNLLLIPQFYSRLANLLKK